MFLHNWSMVESMKLRAFAALLLLLLLATPFDSQAQDDGVLDEPIVVTDVNGDEVTITDISRIITIGGAVTEIVYDLGLGDNIIAVDESSIFPPQAAQLPEVGYIRFLSAEPIVAFNPTLVITTEDAGPAETLQLLEGAGVTVLVAPAEDTLTGTEAKIRTVAEGLGRVDAGEAIIQEMRDNIDTAQALSATVEQRPRVLIVFAGSSVVLGVLGRDSGGNEMLSLAGAENAIELEDNYIPLTTEAIVAAEPDIILTTTLSVERVGGVDAFLDLPGISLTPAAQNGRIVFEGMDDLYLLGFTPRLGDAILDLTYLLHTDLPRPITATIRLDSELSRFEAFIADDEFSLSTTGPYTVFAPVDSGFVDDLSDDACAESYVVEGELSVADLTALGGSMLTTLNGSTISVDIAEDGTILLDGIVTLVKGDLESSNGVVHKVSGTLGQSE